MKVKYDNIGAGYNSTRRADPYLTERLFSLLQPQNNKLYLDIGCGTGNYTCALADKGLRLIGVEPSELMLSVARSSSQDIRWFIGTAEHIPAEDKIFDGIIATLTIHHWKDIKKAFNELNRVLTDEGRIIVFTSTPEQMKGYWLNHYFPKMLYASTVQMPSFEKIQKATDEVGLKISKIEKYFIKDDLEDYFLYVGKNKPECYFDQQIRNGISSFSLSANNDEVNQGLSKLKMDITGNEFEQIKSQYENDFGDYLFITIHKKGST